MRVHPNIELAGYFWLPDHDNYKAPGTLTITDGGKIALEIVGSFSGPTGSMKELNQDMAIGRVIGHVQQYGLVTLEDCIFKKRPYAFGGVTKSEIFVNWLVLGVAFHADEEILFDTFSVSIEGLDEWLGISGLSLNIADDPKNFTLRYSRPHPLKLIETEEFSVVVEFSHTIPSMTNITEAKVQQNAYLKASTNEPKDLRYFTTLFRKLRDFQSFALDEPVSLHSVSATNSAITISTGPSKTRPARMSIYYGTTNHLDAPPKLKLHKMLFRFSDISEVSNEILKSWLSMYETFDPVMSLYFSTKSGGQKYLEGRFLALAQALETLHRRTSTETHMDADQYEQLMKILIAACPDEQKKWLSQRLHYANEISLNQRIKYLMDPFSDKFGNNSERKRIRRLISITRNYLTHYDESLHEESAKGKKLWILSQKIESLLQLHLLRTLGFSTEQLNLISANNLALSQKLKLKLSSDEAFT